MTDALLRCDSTVEEVASAGIKLIMVLYGGKQTDNLNSMHNNSYNTMLASDKSQPYPERLPPTECSAYFHCIRAHLQILQWKNLTTDIEQTKWGWKLEEGGLTPPIPTDLEPAPADVLSVIHCRCKSTSKNTCGTNLCQCRKNGLSCVAACRDCHGNECQNFEKVDMAIGCDSEIDDDADSDSELDHDSDIALSL